MSFCVYLRLRGRASLQEVSLLLLLRWKDAEGLAGSLSRDEQRLFGRVALFVLFPQHLADGISDSVFHFSSRSLRFVSSLLMRKKEQEQRLLSLLVQALGSAQTQVSQRDAPVVVDCMHPSAPLDRRGRGRGGSERGRRLEEEAEERCRMLEGRPLDLSSVAELAMPSWKRNLKI